MEQARPGSRAFTGGSMLPGQAMASIDDLKKELEIHSSNIPLKLSILASLINKSQGEEKIPYLKEKIMHLIDENSLHEAEIDIQQLLSLVDNDEIRLLHCKILLSKKDYLNCMTQLLRLKNVNTSSVFEKNVEELLDSKYFDTLYVIPNLPDLYSSQITYFPELRGKVVLQICSSAYHTYILISTCPHLAYKTGCPQGLYNCSEELQLLEVSSSILAPIDFLSNQKLSMVSCSDSITGVLHRNGRITLWGDLPDERNHLILEHPCTEIVVGGSFVIFVNESSIEFWGKMGQITSLTNDYSDIITLGDLTGTIKCSENHILLLNNGNVFSIGTGEEGQLGLEDIISTTEFKQTEIACPVTQILCNNEVSVAITREVIYVWGLINPLQLYNNPRNF